MKKILTPKIIIKYLIKNFCISLLIFLTIFLSLIILTNTIEEIFFLKEKNVDDDLFLKTIILSLTKAPSMLINMSPFIFLFASIFFFVRLMKNNEISPLNLSGISQNFVTIVPATFSLFLGVILIIVFTPITSQFTKYYEIIKQKYISNDNLVIMSNTGLWVRDKKKDSTLIIRADKIEKQNFDKLSNVTIYKFDNQNNLIERIDANNISLKDERWIINKGKKINKNKVTELSSLNYELSLNINDLKEYFINPNIFSVWNILSELKQMRERGYFGEEVVVTFHKYLSLPFLLFSLVLLANFFTLKTGLKFNNFIYAFFGVLSGIFIYFLIDLSIAIGKSGKVPLSLSVWFPIITILSLSTFGLIKNNEKK